VYTVFVEVMDAVVGKLGGIEMNYYVSLSE
jgi:hypothetical protein